MRRVGACLVLIALMATIVACEAPVPHPPVQFILAISSTAGGSVTEPGEGVFTYAEDTVVSLVAEPYAGYRFVGWDGDVSAIEDVDAAATSIRVHSDYSIIANFDGGQPIYDWYDLDSVREDLSGSYILMNDLDSATAGYAELASPTANEGRGWEPIGAFAGTLAGKGYEVRDLFIYRPGESYVGLFSHIQHGGLVKDLGVTSVVMTAHDVGCLAGINSGTVRDCYATGSVTAISAGGLVADNNGTVSNSYCSVIITGQQGGGLVSRNTGTVSNSYYNYDEALINGQNTITIGALFNEDFAEWLANNKLLDIGDRLSHDDGYYVIDSVDDFKELLIFGQDASLNFRLTDDLDLGAEPNFYIPYLAGEFFGNGHVIQNMSFNSESVNGVGLFGYLAPSGEVRDLGVENISLRARDLVGGLVGYNRGGSVNGCYSTGSVIGGWGVGGLVGSMHYGLVSDSYSISCVAGSSDVGGMVGGLYHGTVRDSYAGSTVTGQQQIGGLIGLMVGPESTVSGSYADCKVSADGSAGGLVGVVSLGTVSNCYAIGNVTADEYVAGLVGKNQGILSSAYSAVGVIGTYQTGGLVGVDDDGTVTSSYWDTEASGQTTSAGGTGKTTAEMMDLATFSGVLWDIVGVGSQGDRNPAHIWNIVDDETYPFLSWEPVS